MPPSEHELRLRERLSRLRNMPLLGGAKLSGELDRLQRQLHLEALPDPRQQARGQQRVAAQGEEVLLHPHRRQPQHVGPHRGQ